VNLFGKSLSQQFECILIRRDLKSESLRSEHRQDVVLVVGHANSVPALLKGLGYPAEINSGNGVRQPVRADSGECRSTEVVAATLLSAKTSFCF